MKKLIAFGGLCATALLLAGCGGDSGVTNIESNQVRPVASETEKAAPPGSGVKLGADSNKPKTN